jgi:hypothetical protein
MMNIETDHNHRVIIYMPDVLKSTNLTLNNLFELSSMREDFYHDVKEWLAELTEWKTNYSMNILGDRIEIWFENEDYALMFTLRWS